MYILKGKLIFVLYLNQHNIIIKTVVSIFVNNGHFYILQHVVEKKVKKRLSMNVLLAMTTFIW